MSITGKRRTRQAGRSDTSTILDQQDVFETVTPAGLGASSSRFLLFDTRYRGAVSRQDTVVTCRRDIFSKITIKFASARISQSLRILEHFPRRQGWPTPHHDWRAAPSKPPSSVHVPSSSHTCHSLKGADHSICRLRQATIGPSIPRVMRLVPRNSLKSSDRGLPEPLYSLGFPPNQRPLSTCCLARLMGEHRLVDPGRATSTRPRA